MATEVTNIAVTTLLIFTSSEGGSSASNVSSRDPTNVHVPDEASGFRFVDYVYITFRHEGEEKITQPVPCNTSPFYLFGGKVYKTREQFNEDFPEKDFSDQRHAQLRRIIDPELGLCVVKNRFGRIWTDSTKEEDIIAIPE